jgi:hypothetical protein
MFDLLNHILPKTKEVFRKIEIDEITVLVGDQGTVKIIGCKKLVVGDQNTDIQIDAKNLNINVADTTEINSKHHLVQISDRIDLNPDWDDKEFKKHKKKRRS